jgi:hypothetical protein
VSEQLDINSDRIENKELLKVITVKFGIRKPSVRKSIAARTSVKRYVRNSLGLKAPRGYGWLTNPKKVAYNRVYNRTSVSAWSILKTLLK